MVDNAATQANASQEEVIDNEEVVNEQTNEEAKTESTITPTKDKQVDNAEASRIGRMVKKQWEKEAEPLVAEIKTLRATVERLTPKEKAEANKPPVEGFPTTPEEFRAMTRWTAEQEAKENHEKIAVYEKGYVSSINKLREEGGELHAQIQELLTKDGSPYNRTHGTGSGEADATINYYRAKADIIADKVKTNSNPFKGNTNGVATGVTASSRVPASKSIGKTKFADEQAEGFAQYLNLSDEERAKVISGKG